MKNLRFIWLVIPLALVLNACGNSTQPDDDIAGSVKGLYLITKVFSGQKMAIIDDPYFYVQINRLSSSRADIIVSNGPQISDKLKCSDVSLTRQGGNVVFSYSDPTGYLYGSITSGNITVEITGNTSSSITMQGKKQ